MHYGSYTHFKAYFITNSQKSVFNANDNLPKNRRDGTALDLAKS